MSPRSRLVPIVLALLALALLGVDRPEGLEDVTEVRHWSYPDYTRVVVELSGKVRVKTEAKLLAAAADRPERLYIDLAGVWVGRRYVTGLPIGDGLLQDVRIGQNTRDAIRVVLDLDSYAHHRVLTLSHPDRLVIDVYGTRVRRGEGGGAPAPSGLRPFQTVVIDPGHGGRDPGAIGIGGLREKDVTLQLAHALSGKLEARGFRVVLTRDDDRALGLEERTAIAEASAGDLFVSLHANASRRRGARGIETYYLDANHERHSLTVAARENGVKRSEVSELQKTIAQLRVSEVSPHSRSLARRVQRALVEGMPTRYRPVTDLGAKKGPFYVLFLSSMPSVLVETGFLTNREESRRLRDPGYVDAVAEQIAAAFAGYRDSGSSFATWRRR